MNVDKMVIGQTYYSADYCGKEPIEIILKEKVKLDDKDKINEWYKKTLKDDNYIVSEQQMEKILKINQTALWFDYTDGRDSGDCKIVSPTTRAIDGVVTGIFDKKEEAEELMVEWQKEPKGFRA